MFRAAGLAALLLGSVASPLRALERHPVRAPELGASEWNAGTTVTIHYYNDCTGWLWLWEGWSAGTRSGVCFDASPGAVLNATWVLTGLGPPCGYGYTGTIAVFDACTCSGTALAIQPFCATANLDWSPTEWGGLGVPSSFLVAITWASPGPLENPAAFASDRGAAGPTGPAACGTCYPTDRQVRSRYWYGDDDRYCPSGGILRDGTCDVELLMGVGLATNVATERESWGKVKALFR